MSFKSSYVALFTALIVACSNGCKSFYEETGTSIVIGDLSAPVDVSTPNDSATVRALYSMDGMKLWTSRGVGVCFDYQHSYTNCYLYGMVEKKGEQKGSAIIFGNTNDLSAATSIMPILREGNK